MRETRPNIKTIVGIVYRILLCIGCVWLADLLWPETPEWWAFGVYAVLFYAAAIVLGVVALCMAGGETIKLARVWRFRGGARAPRADKLAEDDEMDAGGLL